MWDQATIEAGVEAAVAAGMGQIDASAQRRVEDGLIILDVNRHA